MKTVVPRFQLGEVVHGAVSECLSQGDLIISFNGDLLRVANETGLEFQLGAVVELEVASLRPLRFRMRGPRRRPNKPGRFDVHG